jgi:hypothetical protein
MSINWANIYKEYKGQWVALKDDEQTVIASGNSARAAFASANKKGYNNPILTKMPEELINYVGSGI